MDNVRKVGRPKKADHEKVQYAYVSIRPETYERVKKLSKLYRVSMVQLLDDLTKQYWK